MYFRHESQSESKDANVSGESTNNNFNKEEEKVPDINACEETLALAQESTSHSSDASSEEISAASTQPAKSPSPMLSTCIVSTQQSMSNMENTATSTAYLEPSRTTSSSILYNPNIKQPQISEGLINFSEFENESDPFERAELQTLNDMQELAAVFPQINNIKPSVTSGVSISHSNITMDQQHRINQNTIYSQAPHSIPTQSTANAPGQFNSYYQGMHGNSLSQPQPVRTFYTQGKTFL